MVFDEKLLVREDFYTELGKRIFDYIAEKYKQGDDRFSDINESFSEDEIGRITKMKLLRMNLENNGEEILRDTVSSLKTAVSKSSLKKNTSLEELYKLIDRKRNLEN